MGLAIKILYETNGGLEPFRTFIENLVSFFYYQIPIISPIISTLWPYVVVPQSSPLLSLHNILFLAPFFVFFIGVAFDKAAGALAKTIREVDYEITKENIRRSAMGEPIHRVQAQASIPVPAKATISGRWLELFVLPIVTGVIVAAISFLLGFV